MTESSPQTTTEAQEQQVPQAQGQKDSYVKLAMRNMVKKKGLSLKHFFLTTVGLLGFLIGLSYLTR